MPQDQRYGRSPRHDRDEEGNYGRGDDDWRGESRSYRSSRYGDEGGWPAHDRRQDRDYQGTLRAGDYGRYEEEEGEYPERFSLRGRRLSQEYDDPDFGGTYRRSEYGRAGYRGDHGGGYGQRNDSSVSPEYESAGGDRYRGRRSERYGQGANYAGGFGTYTQDYDRKYGGGWSGRGRGTGERNYGNRERDWWDRATDEVSSWFGDEDAERRRQMDQHRGRGPKNYSRSDERICEDVCDRLTDDPLVDASDIEVSVASQEVTLSGTVHTRQQRRLAEDCAESVSGVTHVQNNLRVKQPSWSSGQSGTGSGSQTSFGSGGTTTM